MDAKYMPPNINDIGLTGRWKLHEGSTSDYSANTNDGSASGTNIAAQYPGYSFNGSDDLINIDGVLSDIGSDTAGSFFVWLYTDNINETGNVLTFGDTDANTIIQFYLNGGQLRCRTRDAGTVKWTLTTDADIAVGSWVHCSIVQDGTSSILYVNGVAVSQTFSTSTDKTVWFNDLGGLDTGRIGCNNFNTAGDATFFEGKLDDAQIYNLAKSAAEVLSLYSVTRWRYSV